MRSSAVYAQESGATPTTNAVRKTRLTGLSTNRTAETLSLDVFGNTNAARTAVNRSARTVTQTLDGWDTASNAVSVTFNGLLVATSSKTGLNVACAYDTLKRRTMAQGSALNNQHSVSVGGALVERAAVRLRLRWE